MFELIPVVTPVMGYHCAFPEVMKVSHASNVQGTIGILTFMIAHELLKPSRQRLEVKTVCRGLRESYPWDTIHISRKLKKDNSAVYETF